MGNNIKSILGLTQQEVAMILNVSQSHLAHHQGTRRKLPSTAGLRLNQMLNYMLLPEAKGFTTADKPQYEDITTKSILENRLEDNKIKILKLARKINKAQEKFEKHEKALRLMGFLNSPAEFKKAAAPEILRSIESKAIIDFKKTKSELSLLQIDLELLELQQEYLQKTLRQAQ